MKLLITALLAATLLTDGAAAAHHDHSPAVVAEDLSSQVLSGTLRTDQRAPQRATNCRATVRPSATSASGMCYNWSGSGTKNFWVRARLFDGCRRYIWVQGTMGRVFVLGGLPGKTSYVYTPPGTWRIVVATVYNPDW